MPENTIGKRLRFSDRVISTAADPISTKELLTRLNDLHKELSELEQSEADLASLESIKTDLIHRKLLKNPNHGVQIYVACCLADILRLYAPDAPYSISVLTNIFNLFLTQFPYLKDPDSSLYAKYVYLLERVAEMKLSALMTDLEHSDKLVLRVFDCFYSLAADKSFHVDTLQNLLIDILSEIIGEVNHLDLKVLKLILNKFLSNAKNLKNQTNIKVPGFEISLALCEINSDKLSRLVTYFFSEMILEATTDAESDFDSESENDSIANPSKKSNVDLIQMKKIHTLAIELWRYVPEVLTSVLGLLDNELEADDPLIRTIATETVSTILSIQPSRINFPTTFLETYMNWLKKPLDISIDIRIAWINGVSPILESRDDMDSDIINGLLKTLIDSNDKVRLSTIIELSKLKPLTFVKKMLNDSLVDTLIKLLREKNTAIRNEIIQFLSTMYNFSATSFECENKEFFTKIPNHILNLIYINDPLINSEIDLALFEKLVPFIHDNEKRVDRLLKMLSILTEKSKASFFAIIKRQNQLSRVMLHLFTIIDDEESTDSDKELQISNAVNWISRSFPKSYDAESCLNYFIQVNNKRLFRLVRLCSSENSDYDTVVSSMKEILNRIKEPKFLNHESVDSTSINQSSLYATVKLLLLRCSNIFYNVSNISDIIIVNKDSSSELNPAAKLVLNNISELYPNVLSSNFDLLEEQVTNRCNTVECNDFKTSNDNGNDMKIIYNYVSKEDSTVKLTKEFCDALYNLTLKGSAYEAKYAVRIISKSSADIKGLLFTKMVNEIWPLELNSSHLNTHLSALSMLFLCDPISVDHIKEELSKILASEILLKNHVKEEAPEEITENERSLWIEDSDLSSKVQNTTCLSKILTMELLTNWLISIKDLPIDAVEPVSKPILSMLSSFINRGGEIVSADDTPANFRSRLRLHAGIQFLKLSQFATYDKFIDQRRINRLILLVQDVEFEVRSRFSKKLKKRLAQSNVSKRFLSLMFFTAFEPDSQLRSDTSTWINASFSKELGKPDNQQSLIFEKSFVRLLYMIFNHPEFKELYLSYETVMNAQNSASLGSTAETPDEPDFKELYNFVLTYVVYALSSITTPENISLLYYLTQRVKQYEPVLILESWENHDSGLYLISELTQAAIKYVGKVRNWSISMWPGKLNLPHDLYTKLDNERANEVLKTNYLLDENMEIVNETLKFRWKVEHGVKQAKKPRRKQTEADKLVLREISEKENKRANKKRKAVVRDHRAREEEGGGEGEEAEAEDDDYIVSRQPENIATDHIRRSKRAKRVNYNENDY